MAVSAPTRGRSRTWQLTKCGRAYLRSFHERELVRLRADWLRTNDEYNTLYGEHYGQGYCLEAYTIWEGRRRGCPSCAELCRLDDQLGAFAEQIRRHEQRIDRVVV